MKIVQVPVEGSLSFNVGGKEVIRFDPDGKVTVRGEPAGYAKDILDGLREFLRLAKVSDGWAP
jgi:hypothetical protein